MVTVARLVLLASLLACVYAVAEEGDAAKSFPAVSDGGEGIKEAARGSVEGESDEDTTISNGEAREEEPLTVEEEKEGGDGFDELREMFQERPNVGQPPLKEEEEPVSGGNESSGADTPPEKPVVGYIPELPSSIIQPGFLLNGTWYIMFYAAWCEHSQMAMPEFKEVIQRVVDQNLSTIYIGKIEITKNSEVAKHFEIASTPTFLMFRNGQKYKFEEDRTADNLFNFMRRVVTGEVTRVNSTEHLAELRAAHPNLFLLAHDTELDKDWHGTYMRIAISKLAKGRFAYTVNPAIVEEFKPPSMPSLMVFKGDSVHFFKETMSSYTLSRWITIERFDDFAVVNTSTLRRYLKPATGRRLAILVVSEDPASRRIAQKKAIEVVRKMAASRQDHRSFQFLLLEGTELIENLLQTSNVHLPMLVVYEPYRTFHYVYDPKAPMTEKPIREFLKNISSGDIDPLGGPSYRNTVIYYIKIAWAVVKTMTTHQPLLSGVTAVCLVAVAVFYLFICCCQSSRNRELSAATRAARTRAREAALRAKKKSGKQNGVRRRRGRDSSGSNSEHSDAGEQEADKDK